MRFANIGNGRSFANVARLRIRSCSSGLNKAIDRAKDPLQELIHVLSLQRIARGKLDDHFSTTFKPVVVMVAVRCFQDRLYVMNERPCDKENGIRAVEDRLGTVTLHSVKAELW